MNPVPTLNFLEFIAADGECLSTSSQQVALAFGKRHDNVLRQIRNLVQELPESHRLNFGEASYEVAQTNGGTASYACYRISRDGFALLAMGFTGKKALGFKLAYIDAFNAMAAFIKNQREGLSYRRAGHELAAKDSEAPGRLHGRGLNQRKQELPVLAAEEAALHEAGQLRLEGMSLPARPH
jgi:Rha family phage regulatory protein